MKRKGPDSLEGLFIVVVCCLISTLMYGPAGLSSMIFVACITRYNTDRNKASLPFVLCSVLQSVSGPFTGYLAKKLGIRTVALAGAVLATLGIGLCFLAEDILVIIAFWGILFGTGFGLTTLLLPPIINDYFVKQRSKALGMCYLGSPIGFFVFPPIFEVLLQKYGLSGTFLLISGISMHCIPLCMFLTKPSFNVNNENSPLKCGQKNDGYLSTDCRTSDPFQNSKKTETSNPLKSYFRRFSIEFLWNKSDSTENLTKQYVLSLNKKCAEESYTNPDFFRSFKIYSKSHYKNLDELTKTVDQSEQSNYFETNNSLSCDKHQLPFDEANLGNNTNKKILSVSCNELYEECSAIYFGTNSLANEIGVKNQAHFSVSDCYNEINNSIKSEGERPISSNASGVPTLLKYKKIDEFSSPPRDNNYAEINAKIQTFENSQNNPMLNMYLNPIFILMCVINAIASLHFSTFTTVIIDFSRDLKIDVEYEKYIMMCIALMGAVGMLGFGWVTDGGYLTRTRFGFLSQLLGGISTAVLPLAVGFETLMIALAAWCICQSSFIPIIPAIVAEYFEADIQTVAISACFVLSGPLYLIIPPLIGYFRDEKGSYDNIFYLLGFLSFINSITVFIIPYVAKWKSKKQR